MAETKILPLLTWRRSIAESELQATTKLVAFALSLWMNERGASAYPGAELLARDTSLSVRAVREHLALLVGVGWLELVEKGGLKGERRHANVYRAAVVHNGEPSVTRAGGSPVQETALTPASDDTDPCTSVTPSLQELFSISGTNARPSVALEPYEDEFNALWVNYPRKLARLAALAQYQARRRAGADPVELSRAVEFYAEACRGKDPEFVQHGATFLGKRGSWPEWVNGIPLGAMSNSELGAKPLNAMDITPNTMALAAVALSSRGPQPEPRRCRECSNTGNVIVDGVLVPCEHPSLKGVSA